VRPDRADIAAPELPPRLRWVGEAPGSMAEMTAGGPVLVHFFDFAQLNSVRTLPYVAEWANRYREHGLTVVGVQTPRLKFMGGDEALRRGVEGLGLGFPVALDSKRDLWLDYGCRGWPSLFLWAQGGALAWFHFGEGEYFATETAIQEELRSEDVTRVLPGPVEPLRATDRPGAVVLNPTAELFPATDRAWTAAEDGAGVDVDYEGGGAFITAEGEGTIEAQLDGEPLAPVVVDGAGLYAVAEHPVHERHRVGLTLPEGVALWSVSFAAGVASAERG
jgi:hypothetical protein